MLKGKQKAYLRGLLNNEPSIFQVGKEGLSENLLQQLDDALEARELIKITILNNQKEAPEVLAKTIASRTGAEVVQVIGHKIGLYRRARKPRLNVPD
ncbi:MAG TPA: ribosome assembly RNA-binding protein YhbY [Hydrogenispora sp.]|jgi:RNA-binding protein|nr:ribosome assembly RNA-binding protein YhbY [Hydrogenispora sp.]